MIKFLRKILISSVIFIALTLFTTTAQISDNKIIDASKKLETIIHDGMEKIKIPAVAVSVSRANKVLYTKAFGYTTKPDNHPTPVSQITLFPVSSISKNITAILVGALVDDGRISFTDKVRKYYPEFFLGTEELSEKITIMDLISHSSGFEHFSADTLLKGNYSNDKILRAFRFLKQKPGEFRKYYGYQNVIYGIVGMVIERATGETYEDLIQRYIFDKMGMKNSSAIRLDAEESKWGYCKYLFSRFSHDRQKDGLLKTCWNLIAKTFSHSSKHVVISHSRYIDEIVPLKTIGMFQKFPATSGISLSAEDMGKWVSMLANEGSFNGVQIVSKETFHKLASPIAEIRDLKDDDVTFVQSRYSRDNLFYGMGMFSGTYFDNGKNPKKLIFHMGGIYGSTAFIAVCPEYDIAIGVTCNLGGVAQTLFCEYMVNQFLDLVFDFSKIDWVQADIDRKLMFRDKQRVFAKKISEHNPTPPENMDSYTGTYYSEIYGDIEVTVKDNQLVISNGLKTAKLTHVNGSIFSFPSKDMSFVFFDENEYISFFTNEKGKIDSFYISCFDENNTIFKKK